MKDKIGFGLLGTGLIAPFHAKSILNAANCELIAAADIDAEKTDVFSKEYNCRAYSGLDELLNDADIDVINILTPNHLHKEAVLKAAAAKKHVLVEKPPAMSLTDVDDMMAACNKHDVRFGIVLQCRVRPAIQAVKKAVDEGRFGKLLHADAYMKWHRTTEYYQSAAWRSSRKSGAGVTIQHAFHYMDLLYYLAGDVQAVQARMRNLAHPDVELEDTLLAFLDFKNGAQGVVQASTALWPGTDIRIEINGTDGTAIVMGERIDTWQFKESAPEDESIHTIGSADVSTGAGGPADLSFSDHQILIEDMADAIVNDHDPVIPASDTRTTLEMALAMYQSAKTEARVELPLKDESDIWD
jgi:predicted dehydrogenase